MSDVVPRAPRHPDDDAVFRARRRLSQFNMEALIRTAVCLVILLFNEAVGIAVGARGSLVLRTVAVVGILLNGAYYLGLSSGRYVRPQAYLRIAIDVGLTTVGLYEAGGLAAAPYLGIYTIIAVYAGLVLSSAACVFVTAAATGGYVAAALLYQARSLPGAPVPGEWAAAGFNLLVLNGVGVLTAILAHAYRQSRRRLSLLYQDLERAHDEAFRLNAEIQRVARLHTLGAVVAGVSHEVGNALQTAVLPLELVRRKVGTGAPEVTRHLDQIEHGCETAMRIVGNVLQAARQASSEKVPVSLPEVARRTLELKGYDLRRAGITVQLELSSDLPPIMGVPSELQQVLLNLVTNAQDALRENGRGGSIAIVGFVERERVVVEVRDDGPGVPPETLPRLFEPFYTTKPDGTGLGLAISSDIVRGLGGELTAANRPEGGAVFRVSLPVVSPRSA